MKSFSDFRDAFTKFFANLDVAEKVTLWNAYAYEESGEDVIYTNDEDFFDEFYANDVMAAVRATQFGHYNFSDEYVWFNGYANLDSSDYEWKWKGDGSEDKIYMPINEDTLARYIYDNEVDLSDYFDEDELDEMWGTDEDEDCEDE